MKTEFDKINSTVNELIRSKGDKSMNIDKIVANIPFDDDTFYVDQVPKFDKSLEKQYQKDESHKNAGIQGEKVVQVNDIVDDKTENATNLHPPPNENEDSNMRKDIDNLRMALHAIEANQIEKESQINNIVALSLEIKGKLSVLTELKTDVDSIKISIHRLESVMETKIEKVNNSIQKQTEAFSLNLPKGNIETEIEKLKTEFSQATKMISTEVKEIEKGYKTHSEKLNNEILSLKDLTVKLQDDRLDDAIGNSQNSGANESVLDENVRYKDPQFERKDPDTADVWIIGTSITKDLKAKKMYMKRKLRITTLQDKTILGARNYLKSGKIKADNILLQLGSNDLESKHPEDVIKEMERLIDELKREFPNSKIILVELLPRFYRDRKQFSEFEEKRLLYYALLKDYCYDINADYIRFEQMSSDDFYDGIHFNEYGIRLYVKCLKDVLNPILGVQSNDKTGRFHESQRNVKNNSFSRTDAKNKTSVNYNHNYVNHSFNDNSAPSFSANTRHEQSQSRKHNFHDRSNHRNLGSPYKHTYHGNYMYPSNRYHDSGQQSNRTEQDNVHNFDKERIFCLFEQMLRVV